MFASDPERIYAETDTVAPETAYGRSKAAAEAFLLANLERVTILRTSVLYGYSHPRRRNTVEFIESKLRAGEPIDLFSDVFACPTYIGDLAACVERAVAEGVYGIHHACGAEFVSRCDIAEALCAARGYSRELIRPVPRPASSNVPRCIHLRQSRAMRDLLTTRLADYLELSASFQQGHGARRRRLRVVPSGGRGQSPNGQRPSGVAPASGPIPRPPAPWFLGSLTARLGPLGARAPAPCVPLRSLRPHCAPALGLGRSPSGAGPWLLTPSLRFARVGRDRTACDATRRAFALPDAMNRGRFIAPSAPFSESE